jgi:PKD repeat protein
MEILSDSINCYGESTGMVWLNVSGGDSLNSYSWNYGYTTQNLVNVPAGQYIVTVTYDSVCTDTISTVVHQPSSAIEGIALGQDIMCNGENNGIAELSCTGGTPPYSYLWSLNGETTQSIGNLYAGYYSVTILDSRNCEFITDVLIEEPDLLHVEASVDVSICIGESTDLTATAYGGVSPYSYEWTGIGPGQTITVSPFTETVYYVQATDNYNCKSNFATVTVSLFPPVTSLATAQSDSLCLGDSTYILANFSGGNGGPYSCFIDSVEATLPFIVQPRLTTTYTVTGYDDCPSPAISTQITVVVMDIPVNTFSSDLDKGCQPLEVSFYSSDPEPGQTYLWNFGELDTSNFSLDSNPVHLFETPGIYDVALTTISPFGCSNYCHVSNMIRVYPKPEANFYANPTAVNILEPTVFFENLSVPFGTTYWDFGDGGTDEGFLNRTAHSYSDTGRFVVTLIVESDQYCRDTITLPIQVNDVIGSFYAPNAINLNSQIEENRIFKPQIYGVDKNHYHMIIYDRWGEPIFETFDYYHGWDGRVKGKSMAKIGAYSWIVNYTDLNGKPQQKTGSVVIIDN